MKKLVYLALLGLLAAAPALADQPTTTVVVKFSPDAALARLSKAVLKVDAIGKDTRSYSGSAVVVKTDSTGTTFITAGHVSNSALILFVTYNGKTYRMVTNHPIPGTDAAWFTTDPIPGVVPLEMNLDPSGDSVTAMAFGYWGRAGSEGELTGTMGKLNRSIIEKIINDDFEVWTGFVAGSQLVYFGFSGGVVVDTDLRILGVNSILTPRYTLSVDIRYIWNHMPMGAGKTIILPINDNFNFLGDKVNNLERLRVTPVDKVTVESADPKDTTKIVQTTVTMAEIIKQMDIEMKSINDHFSEKFLKQFMAASYTANGKTYKVSGWKFAGRKKMPFVYQSPSTKYIDLISDGYEIILLLRE